MLLSCACFSRWCQLDSWSELVPKLLHQRVASLFGVSLPWSPHIFSIEKSFSEWQKNDIQRLIRLVTCWFFASSHSCIHAIKTYLLQSFRDAHEACSRLISLLPLLDPQPFLFSPQVQSERLQIWFLKFMLWRACMLIPFEPLLSFVCSARKTKNLFQLFNWNVLNPKDPWWSWCLHKKV